MQNILQLHQQYRTYAATFKGLAKTTLRDEFYIFRQFTETVKFSHPSQVSTEMVINYLSRKKIEQKWSNKTIRNHLQALQNFYKYCLTQNIVKENPITKIERPKLPKRLPEVFTLEQALMILYWADTAMFRYEFNRVRAKTIFATFLFTGIRKSELINLKICDIQLQQKRLKVCNGKGGKDRMIPLNNTLIEILQEYIKVREEKRKKSIAIFTCLREDKRISSTTIKRLMKKAGDDLGLHIHPHKLRHTFGTLMAESECEIYALSSMMGHSDIKTTTTYVHISQKHVEGQIDKHPLGFTASGWQLE